MNHKVYITKDGAPEADGTPGIPIELLSMRVEAVDLAAITRLLTTPPRAKRRDAGVPRKTKEGV